ncbi:hypothetical protein ACLI4U_03175 [Natrialbaceae archaeon A-CW2]|uniref:hypothetical protein n=1 Tax=Natronosalvus amylolyticus TaxID=2961994 RepID=UPI0020C94667|nr:hypothetical protein [Natronosalvus amylolyticus]
MVHPDYQFAVTARVAVRVPVHANGDLVSAGSRIVERTDAVDQVTEATVRGLEPGLNDTTVTLDVRFVAVGERGEDLAVLRRAVDDEVGVSVETMAAVDEDADSESSTPLEETALTRERPTASPQV